VAVVLKVGLGLGCFFVFVYVYVHSLVQLGLFFVVVLFAFVVLGLVSSVLCQEVGWEERL